MIEIRHILPNWHGAYAVIVHPDDSERRECCDVAGCVEKNRRAT